MKKTIAILILLATKTAFSGLISEAPSLSISQALMLAQEKLNSEDLSDKFFIESIKLNETHYLAFYVRETNNSIEGGSPVILKYVRVNLDGSTELFDRKIDKILKRSDLIKRKSAEK